MPLISDSSYKAPFFLSNGHLQTIYPSLFRRIHGVSYTRERINTPDSDFLDLDWSGIGSDKIAIISHGLEGNTYRGYVLGMVKVLNRAGWDALAWNFRGCSGEPNRQLRFYHSGATDDLQTVISHVQNQNTYREISLIGFSMGGNISLKYLGETVNELGSLTKKCVVISVPVDLAASSEKLNHPVNKIYLKRFLRMLHKKIKEKMPLMPDLLNDDRFNQIKNFRDFDDRYTAPINGFTSAEDYWEKCSSKQFINQITKHVLIINAQNDPFLSKECYPVEEVQENPHVFLEMPASGGHVGFIEFNQQGQYWSEQRTIQFLES